MAIYKLGEVWWYRFQWDNREIRRSWKQGNKRVAEQMEAAHRTSLAKGEVGIREAAKSPTLKEFAGGDFTSHIRTHFEKKPKTLAYYEAGVRAICGFSPLAGLRLNEIRAESITGFVQHLKSFGFEI